MSSAEFYDNFISYQVESGINDRIYSLYKRLCKIGIKDSQILEIGCGVGALTYLLAGKIGKGKIEAIDLSPKSIEFARTQIRKSNVIFSAIDIFDFTPVNNFFDCILLFDTLEHIPEEDHPKLFQKLSNWMKDDSLLLINLPNPLYILYDQENNPAALQELDQPIFLDKLSDSFSRASLDLHYMETYSVWVRDDYQFFVVKKRKPFTEKLLSAERNFSQKLIGWIKRNTRRKLYPFPAKR